MSLQTVQSAIPALEASPTFLACLRDFSNGSLTPPHTTLIKICKDQFRLTAFFPYQVREFQGAWPNPIHKV